MHYSIHFARLPGSYAAPRRRNHLRHHNSPEARPYGFAIPSSFWDIIGGTSFPEPNRQSAATLRPDRAGPKPREAGIVVSGGAH
jgi:sterol desaturase/sphingolipid hydroxylase (fatty acid hydroxylase superfamily)